MKNLNFISEIYSCIKFLLYKNHNSYRLQYDVVLLDVKLGRSFDNMTSLSVLNCYQNTSFKGPLSGLRQFLATESPLKTMKKAAYFTSKTLSVLKILKFLS